ncbi:hypothetical protein SAMN05421810_10997 [Amycolatopsis arida]|uniref:Secreted protein n=1 Tax=Amycolatopsis arida TaxID=587909 RepID=A0A1I5ZEA5_9PSEU|nr:hypothetical protein [Amycolatopsis arida]TDX89575.1 hypothetical protein CLV69_10996 [Amycolatopsis arida]SFQ54775.1 hypothetical protein SAMN05421810_10997 [Amycolatopsis arida]
MPSRRRSLAALALAAALVPLTSAPAHAATGEFEYVTSMGDFVLTDPANDQCHELDTKWAVYVADNRTDAFAELYMAPQCGGRYATVPPGDEYAGVAPVTSVKFVTR